jgi:hypothetical protein
VGRWLGGGFLNQQATPQSDAIICGVNRRREPDYTKTQSVKRGKIEPHCGGRPITTMIIEWADHGSHRLTVRTLLDTGCTTLLLSQACADRFHIPQIKRESKLKLHHFAGELIEGAGKAYSAPLPLRYRKHYTREVFEIAPLEPGVDVFLPFWWIAKHAPQGV